MGRRTRTTPQPAANGTRLTGGRKAPRNAAAAVGFAALLAVLTCAILVAAVVAAPIALWVKLLLVGVVVALAGGSFVALLLRA